MLGLCLGFKFRVLVRDRVSIMLIDKLGLRLVFGLWLRFELDLR